MKPEAVFTPGSDPQNILNQLLNPVPQIQISEDILSDYQEHNNALNGLVTFVKEYEETYQLVLKMRTARETVRFTDNWGLFDETETAKVRALLDKLLDAKITKLEKKLAHQHAHAVQLINEI